jgi:hypothetical protein
MSKDKNKDKTSAQAGSINTLTGFKKYARIFVTTLLVVIFVGGAGIAIYKKIHKPKVQAAITETVQLDLTKIPGWWSQQYFGTAACEKETCQPGNDPDKDKLNNLQEYFYHTDPLNPNTAKDTLNDGELVAAGFDPSKPGRVTFEEMITPENLMGESLVFDKDIQQLVADANDISKVNLPLVKDDEIKINYSETEENYKAYSSEIHDAFDRYFPAQDMNSLLQVIQSGSDTEIIDLKLKAEALSVELKTISVPIRLLTFHKYNIAMFQLISEILPAPTDYSGAASDIWFEKVQQFLAVSQRLNFEVESLKRGAIPTPAP